ncbi:unnamed protein product [Moneuplotes crassus]|uniref:Uncharacterized protein n=1 Tax=Euplotes crassus TaxID=5936 RepID=A0AAD2CXY0_EUPCR|nr:unnamed protein product [Moneuplotes crassus]
MSQSLLLLLTCKMQPILLLKKALEQALQALEGSHISASLRVDNRKARMKD